ncbi:hypothetical protein R6Q59_010379 [Mikania micrantha]
MPTLDMKEKKAIQGETQIEEQEKESDQAETLVDDQRRNQFKIDFKKTYSSSDVELTLNVKAGSLAALLCFICWFFGSFVAHQLGFSLAWKVVLAAQLFCWWGQFIGHYVFEKRAPALLDNFIQAFLTGPFFVLLEALQMGLGYEPYPDFHARVKAKVDANIKEWKENDRKKKFFSRNQVGPRITIDKYQAENFRCLSKFKNAHSR